MVDVTSANVQNDPTLDLSIVLMLRLSRLCGLMPLKFRMTRPGRYTSSPALEYYLYGCILIPTIIIFRGYKMYEYSLGPLDTFAYDMKSLVRVSEQILMTMFLMSAVITMKTKMEKIEVFFELLQQIEQKISDSTFVLEKQDRKAMLLALASFCISVMLNTWDLYMFSIPYDRLSVGIQLYMPLCVMKILMWVVQMEFIFLLRVICNRTDALVFKLKCLKDCQYKYTMVYDMLQSAVKTQALLRTSARILNSAFDVPLLCLVTLSLFHLIITPSFVIKYLLAENFSVSKVVLQLTWLLLHIMWTTLLVETAHQFHQKDTTISVHILNWITSLGDSNRKEGAIWRDEQLNRLLLRQRMVIRTAISINAYGISELSRSFLGTICGAITTYIFIFMQIEGDTNII